MSRDKVLAARSAVIETTAYRLATMDPIQQPFAIREEADRLGVELSDLRAAVRAAMRNPRSRKAATPFKPPQEALPENVPGSEVVHFFKTFNFGDE